MDAKVKPSDDLLNQPSDDLFRRLLAERREEVVRLQKAEADRLEDIETRGQARIAQLKSTMPADLVKTFDALDASHREAEAAARHHAEQAKAKHMAAGAFESEMASHPALAGNRLAAAAGLGWFKPYYGTLHGSNGTVYWQGYNPGNIDLSDSASGAGSGLFGTGAGSFTMYMDWWFTYNAPQNRNYAHTIWVPFDGFYILYADDGFWDSKEAHARIDLSAVGYQYNYKATGSTNVFDIDSQNINVNDRFDGWRTMYYSDLLGADTAYLRVTASFYVYARGGGSTAQLNFSDGTANYIGVPWVSID